MRLEHSAQYIPSADTDQDFQRTKSMERRETLWVVQDFLKKLCLVFLRSLRSFLLGCIAFEYMRIMFNVDVSLYFSLLDTSIHSSITKNKNHQAPLKNNTVCGKSFIQKKTEIYTESVYYTRFYQEQHLRFFCLTLRRILDGQRHGCPKPTIRRTRVRPSVLHYAQPGSASLAQVRKQGKRRFPKYRLPLL